MGLSKLRGEARSDLEKRIEEILDRRCPRGMLHAEIRNTAVEIVNMAMDMATIPPDAAIQEAAPDLIPAAGGLYQELLAFVLTFHAAEQRNVSPDFQTVYKRAVHRLREAGWTGGEEFDLWLR